MFLNNASPSENELRRHLVDLFLDISAQLSLYNKGLSRELRTPSSAIAYAGRIATHMMSRYHLAPGTDLHIDGLFNAFHRIYNETQLYHDGESDEHSTLSTIEKTAYDAVRGIYPKPPHRE